MIRARVLAERRSRPAVQRKRDAVRVQAALVVLVERLHPALMTAYAPMPDEPGGERLPESLAAALPAGGRLLLPVLLPDLDLDWAAYTGPGALRPGARGLREPAGARLGPDVITGAQLVVVPAVAVDRAGIRLGRGGGSYDRALARIGPDCVVVAVLDDGELCDTLPAEPHDRPVAAVVTPTTGLVTVGPSGWTPTGS